MTKDKLDCTRRLGCLFSDICYCHIWSHHICYRLSVSHTRPTFRGRINLGKGRKTNSISVVCKDSSRGRPASYIYPCFHAFHPSRANALELSRLWKQNLWRPVERERKVSFPWHFSTFQFCINGHGLSICWRQITCSIRAYCTLSGAPNVAAPVEQYTTHVSRTCKIKSSTSTRCGRTHQDEMELFALLSQQLASTSKSRIEKQTKQATRNQYTSSTFRNHAVGKGTSPLAVSVPDQRITPFGDLHSQCLWSLERGQQHSAWSFCGWQRAIELRRRLRKQLQEPPVTTRTAIVRGARHNFHPGIAVTSTSTSHNPRQLPHWRGLHCFGLKHLWLPSQVTRVRHMGKSSQQQPCQSQDRSHPLIPSSLTLYSPIKAKKVRRHSMPLHFQRPDLRTESSHRRTTTDSCNTWTRPRLCLGYCQRGPVRQRPRLGLDWRAILTEVKDVAIIKVVILLFARIPWESQQHHDRQGSFVLSRTGFRGESINVEQPKSRRSAMIAFSYHPPEKWNGDRRFSATTGRNGSMVTYYFPVTLGIQGGDERGKGFAHVYKHIATVYVHDHTCRSGHFAHQPGSAIFSLLS